MHALYVFVSSWILLRFQQGDPAAMQNPYTFKTLCSTMPRRGGGGGKESPYLEHPPENLWISNQSSSDKVGMVFVDSFCPYHSLYLARRAREIYGISTISCVSSYVAGYLNNHHDSEDADQGDDSNPMDIRDSSFESESITRTLPIEIPKTLQQVKEWKEKLELPSDYKILTIYCESDSGLDECELFSDALNPILHNGYNPSRRDKFLMNQALKEYGLATVKQSMCSTLEEAISFAKDELGVASSIESTDPCNGSSTSNIHADTKDPTTSSSSTNPNAPIFTSPSTPTTEFHPINSGKLGRASNIPMIPQSKTQKITYCVVKPKRGVASDDVYLCSTLEEVSQAFQKIHRTSVFGSTSGECHDAVLIQEFAAGTEYALDIVSKSGEHKVAALWRYDKRPANGSSFVYFATEVVDAHSEEGKQVCDYAMKALDALGWKHGLTHTEVIIDKTYGPRLVEVNCRQHNTNFAPLTMSSIGYNAFDMLLAAYLGDLPNLPDETKDMRLEWDEIPILPSAHAYAAVVHLVSYVEGILVGLNQEVLIEIENLPSVQFIEIYDHIQIGSPIEKTVDIRSDSGWIHLIHDNEVQFQRDYDRIVELMPRLFEVE